MSPFTGDARHIRNDITTGKNAIQYLIVFLKEHTMPSNPIKIHKYIIGFVNNVNGVKPHDIYL